MGSGKRIDAQTPPLKPAKRFGTLAEQTRSDWQSGILDPTVEDQVARPTIQPGPSLGLPK